MRYTGYIDSLTVVPNRSTTNIKNQSTSNTAWFDLNKNDWYQLLQNAPIQHHKILPESMDVSILHKISLDDSFITVITNIRDRILASDVKEHEKTDRIEGLSLVLESSIVYLKERKSTLTNQDLKYNINDLIEIFVCDKNIGVLKLALSELTKKL